MNDVLGSCWTCGRELREADYGRRESCPGCAVDTRTCRNCQHYDPGRNNECRESAAEPVSDKLKGNFCDWFRPARPEVGGGLKKETDAKSAFDRLFKKK
ncbi:MAG: hypothetical protein HYV15_05340 [Elusimicrobia bacterium]|nr:hypothetical protein [Elusimicrobiota bacterium]